MPDTWIGRLIGYHQRYRLDKRLGADGMGDVFLAMDTLLGQHVALKLLKDTLVGSGTLRKRFEREVAVCAALKSDHIIQISDYGVTPEGHPFYVMEYLRGQSLGQLLRQDKRLSVERTVGIITQVCEGLHLAHQGVTLWRDGATVSEHVKVVHRDLKPDNIFLVPTALGELVKLLDFGVAKICCLDTAEHTNLTNMFIGTFHYAAPEQLAAQTDLDGRADIYSLGIILYEMLSGTDAFGLGFNIYNIISEMSWALAHISKSKPVIPLRSQPGCDQLSPELEAVVMRCLQKAPLNRFTSVDELKRDLQGAVANIAIPQSPTPSELGSDNKTILRPLTLPGQGISNPTIAETRPPSREGSTVSGVSFSPEQHELREILMELVGPIAPTLLQQVSAQARSTKELVENLAQYLAPNQRIEFEKRTKSLLGESPVQPQPSSHHSPSLQNPAINPSFVN